MLAGGLLASCGQPPEVPTRVPLAVLTTNTPTATSPPTLTPTPTEIPPTATPTPTPVIAFRPPTGDTPSGTDIALPGEDGRLLMGAGATINGRAQLEMGQKVQVTLTTATGWVLALAETEADAAGKWQAVLSVPDSASGAAFIEAAAVSEDGSTRLLDRRQVELWLDTSQAERYLSLFRPEPGAGASAGLYLFFDGRVQFPVGNLLTISIWDNDCRQALARQSYRLRGSGYWQGFVAAPRELAGRACAVASTGTPGDPEWREAQVFIDVHPPGDVNSRSVRIGNPPPGAVIQRNQSQLLYGTAWFAPGNQVRAAILLENGRVLNEGVALVDGYGYWELRLFVPGNALGQAEVRAETGSELDGTYADHRIAVEIEP
jgi:hypothetical protein